MRPNVIEARDAARRLKQWLDDYDKKFDWQSVINARRDLWELLEYHGTNNWQFGWYVSDFGDAVVFVGLPTDANRSVVAWFETPAELIDHVTRVYSGEAAENAKQQLQQMGVTL